MAPIRQFAIALGVLLTAIGIMGFFDPLIQGTMPVGNSTDMPGLLLGLFAVNTVHNLVHIGSGLLGIAAGLISWPASRLYAQAFGIVYALVALVGLLNPQGTMFLGVLPLNMADTVLHVVISLVSLYFGFSRQFIPRRI